MRLGQTGWLIGDLFMGVGGGTVLWQIMWISDDKKIVEGRCLADQTVRTFLTSGISVVEGHDQSPYPLPKDN